MSIWNRLWKFGLVIVIASLVVYSCGKPVRTIDIAELKRIEKSEGVQQVLISNNIRCISADDKSVWIATDRGVSRLERATKKWKNYTMEDGLSSDNINAVASSGDHVWFGTDDGVNQYNATTGNWRTFREKDGLKGKRVFRIAVDGDRVWFGTDRGINRYTRRIDSWSARTEKDGLSNNIVSAIAVENDVVWVGTHNSVNRYTKATDSWNVYSEGDGLAHNLVTAIATSDNHVWFGTYRSGVSVYNKTNQTFMKIYTKSDVLSSDDIRSIAIDGNNVWIGTANGGVHRYIEPVDTWVRYTKDDGLVSNHISWIASHKNEIWLGTYDSGVSMYDKVKNRWVTFIKADSPPEDCVKAIARSGSGKLWVATSGGLMQYDPESDEWRRFGKKDGLPTEYITALITDEDMVWIGSTRGLASYHEKSGHWQFYSKTNGLTEDFISSLAIIRNQGANKELWVGTNQGLFFGNMDFAQDAHSMTSKFQPVSKNEDLGGFSGYTIASIAQEGHRIWIGTDKGLWEYDASGGKGSLYTTEHGLTHNYVNCVLPQGDRVWVGTQDGIGIYHKVSGIWQSINMTDKLPSRNVRTLMDDSDRHVIWIGTNDGLAGYITETGKLEVADGTARHNITSITRFADNILWLGTSTGVVEYNISSEKCMEYRAFVTRQPLKEASVANIEFDGDTIWFSNWSASHNGAIVKYDKLDNTWHRFTREAILGNTKVRSPTIIKRICADDKWVWFATDYGVLQYDKSADIWRHFTTQDGLASDNIRCIQSGANVVWVCPELRTRINKYNKKDGTWSEVKLSNLIHPRNYVYDMQTDGDALWLTISSSGVRRISEDGEQRSYMRDDGLAQMGARLINVDENYVWVAHWEGRGGGTLSRYDKKTGQWKIFSSSDVLEADMISRIVTGKEYTWIVYESWREGSVTGYNRKTGEWTTIKLEKTWASQIMEVCEDEGHLWLAPQSGGIKRYHLASGTVTSFRSGEGPMMDFVNQRALRADDKYVWIGTPGGISRYDKGRESWANYTMRNALPDESVQAVVSDDKYVWCGTSQGISRYDKVYGTWTNLSRKRGSYAGIDALSWPEMKLRGGMMNDNINAMAVDDRFLWVATRDGAGRYDKITDRWDGYGVWNGLPGMDISSVAVDGYNVWVGANGGVGRFPRMSDNPNAWIRYTSGLEIKAEDITREYANTLISNEVWSIAVDKDYVWIGTMRGVSRYNKEADTWTTYTTEDGLTSNGIGSICVDNNAIWFGSDSGVTVYDKGTGRWIKYTALPSNRITCVAVSPDAVWLGTFDAGLIRYDKKTGSWRKYSREDGLAHECILSMSVDGEWLWVGTKRGLGRYDMNANNWTIFTEYGDSEDELSMVEMQAAKAVKQGSDVPEISMPIYRDLKIVEIRFDPPGRDEEDLNGEWVKIVNTTDVAIDMTRYTLSDYAGYTYEFKNLLLPAHSNISVFTGPGTDTPTSLYWRSKTPIWNNRGDTAYLRDADGKLADKYSYGPRENP